MRTRHPGRGATEPGYEVRAARLLAELRLRLARLDYEVSDVVPLRGGATLVELAGRVSGVLLLDANRGEHEVAATSFRERGGHLLPPGAVATLAPRWRRTGLAAPDLVSDPYPSPADYRALLELRDLVTPESRGAYVRAAREVLLLGFDAVSTPEGRVARTALLEWNSLDPGDVSGALSLLTDLTSGAPLEWVVRRHVRSTAR